MKVKYDAESGFTVPEEELCEDCYLDEMGGEESEEAEEDNSSKDPEGVVV